MLFRGSYDTPSGEVSKPASVWLHSTPSIVKSQKKRCPQYPLNRGTNAHANASANINVVRHGQRLSLYVYLPLPLLAPPSTLPLLSPHPPRPPTAPASLIPHDQHMRTSLPPELGEKLLPQPLSLPLLLLLLLLLSPPLLPTRTTAAPPAGREDEGSDEGEVTRIDRLFLRPVALAVSGRALPSLPPPPSPLLAALGSASALASALTLA